MSVFIGRYNGKWVHTYSKDLRDKHLGNDYVVVYTMGTGRDGGTKIRGSTALSKAIKEKKKVPAEEWLRAYT